MGDPEPYRIKQEDTEEQIVSLDLMETNEVEEKHHQHHFTTGDKSGGKNYFICPQ
ncbi:hypothetical protein QQF64_018163 [Cirrhinus molitorella]|uniref:Uncharacterized protein n=1 Tax=Cirrhinus molitorella TaxID=172907 RepID=A0ABR3LM46_9TELE